MTRALPFTQASLRRAIAAAQKAGLRVRGIRPDGTIVVDDGDAVPFEVATSSAGSEFLRPASKWEDVEA